MTYLIKTDKNKLNKLKYAIFNSDLDKTTKKEFLSFFDSLKARKTSKKIQDATVAATKARTNAAKKKIQDAINMLRFENKKITYYSISKYSNVSYNTVKKYLNLKDENLDFNLLNSK